MTFFLGSKKNKAIGAGWAITASVNRADGSHG
jgi:hypothetical protein